eukprot:CAMPEP_0185604834 /NCGR_PEP_ID=MMETSP0436-20130131/3586_1 /TAXON_ID=626734 ORGANISM="Favella taraikaensis, Strain Fe Narragansett Bay" /NCGR_SAMPLE_ID=MMETSP0436 /ASSEMBLY_ACC=CAM_ASM_000390 /LENGTH=99 /DNA_ID=CAMNT_0028235825 /DNA_START=1545 /DNA_END=1839 /DNA_ORIENTATION=-
MRGEPHVELFDGHFLYLLIGGLLLIEELAAGEADDLEAGLLVSLVQLDHLSVVALGEGSLGSHIGDKQTLFTLHEVAEHVLVQVDVSHEQGPQLANEFR